MRSFAVRLHRYLGLTTASFLFIAGLTGAVIAWNDPLDAWLNPELRQAKMIGTALPALDLARQVEANHPQVRVAYLPLAPEPGRSLVLGVEPRIDPATGQFHDPGFNQIFLDPASGEELGRRQWDRTWPISRATFVFFLYKFHYSLHLPALWGIDRWGTWLMGAIAVLWLGDSFIGFYLTLPNRPSAPAANCTKGFLRRWKPAWQIRFGARAYRLTFDVHRAFSLWTFALLVALAFTGAAMNFYQEAFYPLLSRFSAHIADPFATRAPERAVEPHLSFAEILVKAEKRAGEQVPPTSVGALAYNQHYGIYSAFFFPPGGDRNAYGVAPPAAYYDGRDGTYLGDRRPWQGSVADAILEAQFPIHSGRIIGTPGRILVSLMGLVVALLSATGVVIWWKKRRARTAAKQRPFARMDLPGSSVRE